MSSPTPGHWLRPCLSEATRWRSRAVAGHLPTHCFAVSKEGRNHFKRPEEEVGIRCFTSRIKTTVQLVRTRHGPTMPGRGRGAKVRKEVEVLLSLEGLPFTEGHLWTPRVMFD